jgi:hypothetical protein
MSSPAPAALDRGLFDLNDQLDFDEGAERQGVDAERGAGVTAAVAEEGDEQIGAAVHDLGLILKVIGAVHEAADAHDALHFGEVADLGLERGEQGERGLFGGVDGVLLGGVAADFAGDDLAGDVAWKVAREKDQVTAPHGGHVVRHGCVGRGQGEAEFFESALGRAGEGGGREQGGGQQGEAEWAGRHADVSLQRPVRVARLTLS